jgi:hypothetical protein
MEPAMAALMLTAMMLGTLFVLIKSFAPKCPECGSLWTTSLWVGLPIWVCQRCQNVWRLR